MALHSLDHVTIRPRDLEATRDFYVNIVGLRDGQRPPFGFPGYWLYAGEVPVIHLVGAGNPTDDFVGYSGATQPAAGSGAVDHVAFTYDAEDYDKTCAAIAALGFASKSQTVPKLGLRQLFIKNPDDVLVELNFPVA
ncbi:MAG: VOC family protein [Proteobacteria bacterium]|nr:VOC family protein [Pseudomonadota bacterium]MDA1356262.1 VOC family protein [Pseudomonadota bacterium]